VGIETTAVASRFPIASVRVFFCEFACYNDTDCTSLLSLYGFVDGSFIKYLGYFAMAREHPLLLSVLTERI
jgi:hypothetical protein